MNYWWYWKRRMYWHNREQKDRQQITVKPRTSIEKILGKKSWRGSDYERGSWNSCTADDNNNWNFGPVAVQSTQGTTRRLTNSIMTFRSPSCSIFMEEHAQHIEKIDKKTKCHQDIFVPVTFHCCRNDQLRNKQNKAT